MHSLITAHLTDLSRDRKSTSSGGSGGHGTASSVSGHDGTATCVDGDSDSVTGVAGAADNSSSLGPDKTNMSLSSSPPSAQSLNLTLNLGLSINTSSSGLLGQVDGANGGNSGVAVGLRRPGLPTVQEAFSQLGIHVLDSPLLGMSPAAAPDTPQSRSGVSAVHAGSSSPVAPGSARLASEVRSPRRRSSVTGTTLRSLNAAGCADTG